MNIIRCELEGLLIIEPKVFGDARGFFMETWNLNRYAEAGLKTRLHAYGTNIEGEWDDVFAAIKRCHEVVHAMGTPRVSSTLRFGTRIDRQQTMDEKVRSVQQKLGE